MELPGEPWKRKEKNKMPSSCQGDKGEDKEVSYFKCIKIANCKLHRFLRAFQGSSKKVVWEIRVPAGYLGGT